MNRIRFVPTHPCPRHLLALFISREDKFFFPNRNRATRILRDARNWNGDRSNDRIEFETSAFKVRIYCLQGKRFLLLMQLRFRTDKPLQTSALRCLQRGSLFRGRTVRFRTGETSLFKLMVPDTQNPWELLQGFRGGQNITAPCNSRNASLMKKISRESYSPTFGSSSNSERKEIRHLWNYFQFPFKFRCITIIRGKCYSSKNSFHFNSNFHK